MIYLPQSEVVCDQCNSSFLIDSEVRNGQWTLTDGSIKRQLSEAGWKTKGDKHFCCDDCMIEYGINEGVYND